MGARQAQDSSQSADAVLLLRGKFRKRASLRAGLGATMVTNREREQFPIFVGPSRRNDEAKQELSGGLLGWLARARVPTPCRRAAVSKMRRRAVSQKAGAASPRLKASKRAMDMWETCEVRRT